MSEELNSTFLGIVLATSIVLLSICLGFFLGRIMPFNVQCETVNYFGTGSDETSLN